MEAQVFRAEPIIAACGASWCSAERTAGFCIFYYHRIHTAARNTSAWTNFIYFSGLFILEVYEYPGECAHMAAKTAVHVSNTWLLVILSVAGSTGSD